MEHDITILLLRLGLLAVLYFFLFELLIVLWRDLRPQASMAPIQTVLPALEMLDPASSGKAIGDQITLQAITSVGRSQGNAVVLADPSVSAEHALVSFRLGRWWIEDLVSTNGTYVNDVRVDQPTIIGTGDIVRLGSIRLRVHL